MTQDLSVVLVSNRGPVTFVETDEGFETQRGAGGLAGALDWVARELGERATWVATATSDTDKRALAGGAADNLRDELGYEVELLDIEDGVYSDYYDTVSNRMLWFANHCLWDELGIKQFGEREMTAWANAYDPVNKQFAEVAGRCCQDGALVLFQDYHLTTAPAHLRAARPDQTILHFTHSSFCGPQGLDRLPEPIPRAVIEGMLGADLVGFHVPPWVRGFYESCRQIDAEVDEDGGVVRHNGRTTWVRSYPIPIDAHELRERARGEVAQGWARRVAEETEGPVIVRADRVEPSKNIVRGFQAYGMVLDRRPDLAEKARFVACLYPSRQSMQEYQDYSDEVRRAVDDINVRHPGAVDMWMENNFERTIGTLQVYDVLLVNSIMDGMNLVSKEGTSVNQRSGVLVLSKGAGSFTELGEEAVAIDDPFDVSETAAALERALDMPMDERARRARRLQEKVSMTKPEDWIDTQVRDLTAISKRGEPATPAS